MADKSSADAVEEKAEVAAVAVKKKASIVKILALLVIALVVILGIVVAGWFVLSSLQSSEAGAEPKAPSGQTRDGDAPPVAPGVSKEVSTFELKPFVVNLANEGSYLKVTMALGYSSPEQESLLKAQIAQVRDAILAVLSTKSAKTMSTKHGKMKLKEDIKEALDSISDLRGVVTSVYFTDFQVL